MNLTEWNPILDLITFFCLVDYFLHTHREEIDNLIGIIALILLALCFVSAK